MAWYNFYKHFLFCWLTTETEDYVEQGYILHLYLRYRAQSTLFYFIEL